MQDNDDDDVARLAALTVADARLTFCLELAESLTLLAKQLQEQAAELDGGKLPNIHADDAACEQAPCAPLEQLLSGRRGWFSRPLG